MTPQTREASFSQRRAGVASTGGGLFGATWETSVRGPAPAIGPSVWHARSGAESSFYDTSSQGTALLAAPASGSLRFDVPHLRRQCPPSPLRSDGGQEAKPSAALPRRGPLVLGGPVDGRDWRRAHRTNGLRLTWQGPGASRRGRVCIYPTHHAPGLRRAFVVQTRGERNAAKMSTFMPGLDTAANRSRRRVGRRRTQLLVPSAAAGTRRPARSAQFPPSDVAPPLAGSQGSFGVGVAVISDPPRCSPPAPCIPNGSAARADASSRPCSLLAGGRPGFLKGNELARQQHFSPCGGGARPIDGRAPQREGGGLVRWRPSRTSCAPG